MSTRLAIVDHHPARGTVAALEDVPLLASPADRQRQAGLAPRQDLPASRAEVISVEVVVVHADEAAGSIDTPETVRKRRRAQSALPRGERRVIERLAFWAQISGLLRQGVVLHRTLQTVIDGGVAKKTLILLAEVQKVALLAQGTGLAVLASEAKRHRVCAEMAGPGAEVVQIWAGQAETLRRTGLAVGIDHRTRLADRGVVDVVDAVEGPGGTIEASAPSENQVAWTGGTEWSIFAV
jgi:hypothetical protein